MKRGAPNGLTDSWVIIFPLLSALNLYIRRMELAQGGSEDSGDQEKFKYILIKRQFGIRAHNYTIN